MARATTITGGRNATEAIIPGRSVLSVGLPDLPAPEGWHWTLLTSVARLASLTVSTNRFPMRLLHPLIGTLSTP